MSSNNLQNHLFFPLLLFVFLPLVMSKVVVTVTSDQPGIIGSSITFTAVLTNPEQPSYDIAWQELLWPNDRNSRGVLTKENGYTSNWTLTYWENTKRFRPGTYSVTATVSYTYIFFNVNVGTYVSYFTLTKDFGGTLEAIQKGPKRKSSSYVSTLNETELHVNVHDPYSLLSKADNVTFSWHNQTGFMANTTVPTLKYNFTTIGDYSLNVTLEALYNTTKPNVTSAVKYGLFQTNITAKVPIVNFTVTGKPWFRHGEMLNLKTLCDGSFPFTYCFQLKSGPYNLTGNETCKSPTMTNDCDIPFMWYFSESGVYSLVIIMENDVSRVVNKTLINVYNVSKKQPLSIVIVPITFTLFALILIIFGIAYFWENRAQFTVEVADFDFGHSDELPYMTFMERLKDAMTSTVSTRQRLYHPPDDEPILSSRRPSQFS